MAMPSASREGVSSLNLAQCFSVGIHLKTVFVSPQSMLTLSTCFFSAEVTSGLSVNFHGANGFSLFSGSRSRISFSDTYIFSLPESSFTAV